jgi:signal transduction histidine kinase
VKTDPPKKQGVAHLYWLAAAFAVVAFTFLVGSAVGEATSRGIDAEVTSLKGNSLPSVDRLLSAEDALRRLMLASDALADATADPRAERTAEAAERARAATAEVLGTREALDEDLKGYLSLASSPEERDLYASAVAPRVHLLDGSIEVVRGAANLGREPADPFFDQLHRDVELLSGAVHELVRLNAVEAAQATSRIADVRARAIRALVFLDVGSAALSVIAATLALGAARRFAAAMKQNAELLTDRATELEMFGQRVAHDLLSPLSIVSLSMGLLAKQHPDARTQETVKRATLALDRSRKLVDGILAFARAGGRPNTAARAELKPAVATAIEGVIAAEGPAPIVDIEPIDDVAVACDAAVLVTMLTNLLSNAAKYTREMPNRRITVRALVTKPARPTRGAEGRVRVEIEDTGPGIPPDMEDSIFNPYVRAAKASQPGIGLGLATVKRFAGAHGGTVGVRRLDSGSVFWFELPLAHEPTPVAVTA